jgi:hypothetical protein
MAVDATIPKGAGFNSVHSPNTIRSSLQNSQGRQDRRMIDHYIKHITNMATEPKFDRNNKPHCVCGGYLTRNTDNEGMIACSFCGAVWADHYSGPPKLVKK